MMRRSETGTYALILEVGAPFSVAVGKLGLFCGEAGWYIYCGSAFGPGGLRARTAHHGRDSQRPHWHIDYLKPVAGISEIWYTTDPVRREHDWIRLLRTDQRITAPRIGFGSSDCACDTHLLYSAQKPSFHAFVRKAHADFPVHGTISRVGSVPFPG
ncbi:GIY-YIG nuclease family protein [bacterium]|nr:GIY-YIG nuclease family protein [bacterium]